MKVLRALHSQMRVSVAKKNIACSRIGMCRGRERSHAAEMVRVHDRMFGIMDVGPDACVVQEVEPIVDPVSARSRLGGHAKSNTWLRRCTAAREYDPIAIT